jgi:hypothetical protein
METIISIHDKYNKRYIGCGDLIVFYNDNRENLELIKTLPIIKHYIIDNGYLIVLQYDHVKYATPTEFYNTIMEFASEARIKNLLAYSKSYDNTYNTLMKHYYVYFDRYYEISIYNNDETIINITHGNTSNLISCNLNNNMIYNMLFASNLFNTYIKKDIGANINDYIHRPNLDTIDNFDNIYDEVILELGIQNLYM